MMPPTREQWLVASCRHLTDAVTEQQLNEALKILSDWSHVDGQLQRQFQFADYHQTMAFVNAVADIAHQEDHHPEMIVGYNRCTVRYSTHSVNQGRGGMSHNDFICAAKIDQIHSKTA